jgi:hypothetical protein
MENTKPNKVFLAEQKKEQYPQPEFIDITAAAPNEDPANEPQASAGDHTPELSEQERPSTDARLNLHPEANLEEDSHKGDDNLISTNVFKTKGTS